MPTSYRQPPNSLWIQRAELISGRCNFVLEEHGVTRKGIRSFVQAMAKWFWSEQSAPNACSGSTDFSLPYTRPVSKTIWDERFDLTTSIANQLVTKDFLKMIGSRKELTDHRFYGYVAALALLEILEGLIGTKPEELGAFEDLGGPHEEGGPDWTVLELENETYSMIESMLGKAEEFVFKADVFEEAAIKGAEGAPFVDDRWEPPVLDYLLQHKDKIEEFRKPSGKINRNGLAKHLVEELQAKREIKLPKSDRTIADRLRKLLPKAGILEMRA